MAAKNQLSAKHQVEDDLYMLDEPYPDGSDMVNYLVQVSHSQMEIALGLTKLVVDKQASANEAGILATYKQALDMINENSPFKQMWELVNKE